MKRILFSIVLTVQSCLMFGQITSANQASDLPETFYKNEYSFGFFQLFNGAFNTGYEVHLNKMQGFRIEAELQYSDNLESSTWSSGEKRVGGMLQLQYKYYVLGDKTLQGGWLEIGGLYLGPFAKGRTLTVTTNNGGISSATETDEITAAMLGVLFGGRIYVFDKIVIDASFGGGMRVSSVNDTGNPGYYKSSSVDVGYSGIAPSGNLTIGVRF